MESHVAAKGMRQWGTLYPLELGNYTATIANTTPAAEMIGQQPLQDALNATART